MAGKMDAHVLPIAIAIGTRSIKMVLMMVIFIPSSQCFVFDLHSGRTKCISEELREHAVTVGNYKILVGPPHHHNISARVNGPDGYSIHKAESVDSGEFAFTVSQTGEHTICFWTPYFDLSTSFPIEFVWKTAFPAKDWAALAKKDKLDAMTLQLMKLGETIIAIHEEMTFLRAREEELHKLSETTNTRMASLTILPLFICLGVAGLQLWHLKGFFERKKIL